jgi:hypothetical protein
MRIRIQPTKMNIDLYVSSPLVHLDIDDLLVLEVDVRVPEALGAGVALGEHQRPRIHT